ncbi:MAG: flagellar hook-associated protein FlgK [Pirellulaceae bacterium]|nr:flagellar hook-associated protein FlgK [Pirellulaceae bacterium]
MTLFSSIQTANNALLAAQLGLQVTGNNIANANTPGYVRERLVLVPGPTQTYGNLLLGTGVKVDSVQQVTDRFLEERLRNAGSDLANSQAQQNTYVQLESLIGELSDTDLSTALTSFFNSIQDILNQPDSAAVRNLAVLQGKTLTDNIRQLDARVREIRQDVNNQVIASADDINHALSEVARLNVQIVKAEGGDTSASDAIGLRDRRTAVLNDLAQLIDIKSVEQPTGDVTVFAGGEYLVAAGSYREVTALASTDRGLAIAEIRLKETDSPITAASGKLAGLIRSRDEVLGGFLDGLDNFARALMYEFNKLHAGGQGLEGYSSLESEFAVDDLGAALDQAGLKFTPSNGSFSVQVLNTQTGLSTTTDIRVDLNGLDDDTSLADLAAALDAIDGISATITPSRRLRLEADTSFVKFSFAGDTSGALAALGINTFFTGAHASDIGISREIRTSPGKFAASGGGIAEDTDVAAQLATLLTAPISSQNDQSLALLYDRITGDVTQGAAVTKSVAEGFEVFQQTLEGQYLSVTGVNLDEEAVRMIAYQRAFQASARVIATINELLEVLINL